MRVERGPTVIVMSEDVIGLDGGCDARYRGEPPEPGAERGEVRDRASERAEQREVDGIEPDKRSEQQDITRRDCFPVQESPSIAEPRFQAAQRGTWSVSPAASGHGGLMWTTLRRFGG